MQRGHDIYDRIRSFAACLRKQGQSEVATELENTIAFGATATEILMGVRWQLKELKKRKVFADVESMTNLIEELNKLLA